MSFKFYLITNLSLIVAVFRIPELTILELPDAIRLVSKNPAKAARLFDRGEISIGKRADLIAVDVYGNLPQVTNAVYFIMLRKAYRYASVALVYPIVRSSPVLIVIWGWLIFDQNVSFTGMLGIGISVLGLWILPGTSKQGNAARALPWALIAAVATSIYSLSDKIAVSYLPTFGAQLGFITIGYAVSFISLAFIQFFEHGTIFPACRPKLVYIVSGGLFIGMAYALVVRAMLEIPAAYVVSFTNAGIVLATILSICLFNEKERWRMRVFAACIVTLGLIILGIFLA